MTTSKSVFHRFIVSCILSSSLVCSFNAGQGYAFEVQGIQSNLTHTIQLSSLSASSVCDHFTKAKERESTLPVVDKHGPCHKPNKGKLTFPSYMDVLQMDRLRVNSIRSRSKSHRYRDMIEVNSASIPAQDGTSFGGLNFVATVGFGTPKKDLSLAIDTGSDLTWTQCEPCQECYDQKETKFNRDSSSTYANVSSTSALCEYVQKPDAEDVPKDVGSTCVYKVEYEDEDSTVGLLAQETLTFTSTEKIDSFLFGCGLVQEGTFSKEAGILGLNREKASIISQTTSKYNGVFSYCLPSTASKVGHLTFGQQNIPATVKYTPFSSEVTDDYGVDLVEIHLGGVKLNIEETVLTDPGTIVDSGSLLTYLPEKAYEVLRTEFRKQMSAYPLLPNTPPGVDTCYDLANFDSVTVPQLSLVFKDNLEMSIPKTGILFKVSPNRNWYCLPFTESEDEDEESIIGNIVQKTMEVVFDVPGKKIGLASNACT